MPFFLPLLLLLSLSTARCASSWFPTRAVMIFQCLRATGSRLYARVYELIDPRAKRRCSGEVSLPFLASWDFTFLGGKSNAGMMIGPRVMTVMKCRTWSLRFLPIWVFKLVD